MPSHFRYWHSTASRRAAGLFVPTGMENSGTTAKLLSLAPQARHMRRLDEEAASLWDQDQTCLAGVVAARESPKLSVAVRFRRGVPTTCLSGVSGLRACLKSRRLPFDSAGRHQNNRAVAERSKASVCKTEGNSPRRFESVLHVQTEYWCS